MCILLISTPTALGAEAMGIPSQQEMVQSSIRDRVVALRQQRRQQMPYLSPGFIRTTISPAKIQSRQNFAVEVEKPLEELIGRALEVYTPAKTAKERISLSKRRILVAVRNLFPDASFEFEERKGRLSNDPFNDRGYQIALRQPLFRGGALWNTLLQEKVNLEASRKEYEAATADLINDVSGAYFEYNRALEVKIDQEMMMEKIKRYADLSTQKFKEGIVSEIEHLNVQSLYSQIQYDFETSNQEMEIAQLELQKFLDLDSDQEVLVEAIYDIDEIIKKNETDLVSDIPIGDEGEYGFSGDMEELPDLSELVDMAYENRPELRVEASRLDAARYEERIRWGELMPQADLIFEFGKSAEAFDNDNNQGRVGAPNPALREDFRLQIELSWNAMGNTVEYDFEHNEQAPSVSQFLSGTGSDFRRNTIRVGVLDGLQALVDTKEAEVEKLEQIEELEETEKEVVLDVKQSYYDYQKAKIQVRSSLQRVNYRRRLASLSEFRLGKNEIEISEYLQAEIDLLNEFSSLHSALSDYYTAKATLNRAIGLSGHFAIEDSHDDF